MKKSVRVVLIAAAILLVLAVAVFAAGEAAVPGSEGDPLVTLSYINEVFTGYVKELFHRELTETAETVTASLEDRIAALEEASELTSMGRTFEPVLLTDGETLVCKQGAEVLLRSGGAALTSGEIADTGGAAAPLTGEALAENRMYLVTGAEASLRASGKTELLVRGAYELR